MTKKPKHLSLNDGEYAGGGRYKYTCQKCGKSFTDSLCPVNAPKEKICNTCINGRGRSKILIDRGRKMHKGGVHTRKPFSGGL